LAALTDISDLLNRFTGGNSGTPEHLFFNKDGRVAGAAATAPVAGRWTSFWQYEGTPSHGAVQSSTGAAFDNTTDGGLKQADPGGGREKWLTGAVVSANAAGVVILYDRLAADGGLSGTTTTTQAVSFTAPSRYSGTASVGNQIWLEIQTIIGTTGTTVTAEYTDQDGNTAIVSPATAIGATGLREAQRIIPISLAAGDTGVRNITNIDLLATTGTAGDIAAVLVRPLAILPVNAAGMGIPRDFITGIPGPIEIETDACLAFAWLANSTTIPGITGSLHMVEA
jgi:hypothetical protein